MFAYWQQRQTDWGDWSAVVAKEQPHAFARIMPAGPWQYSDLTHDGKRGVLASWRDPNGRVPSVDEFGKPVQCEDGLLYFPPKTPPTQKALAKASIPPWSKEVTLTDGRLLSIGVATDEPRKVVFKLGAAEVGEASTDFGATAFRLQQALMDDRSDFGAMMARVAFLSVQACYRVTEELLSDLGWINTTDLDRICAVALGADPKSVCGGDA